MSQVRVSGNASGTGILTLTSPNTNSNYTLTLPANTGTLLTTASAGTVLQVVNATYGTQVSTTSTSFVTTGFSASITPSSASSKILVFFTANGYQTATYYLTYTVYRGATNLGGSSWGFGSLYGNTGDRFGQVSGSYLDSPATTSSTTYTVYYKVTGGTGYINLNTGELSTMTLMEIAA